MTTTARSLTKIGTALTATLIALAALALGGCQGECVAGRVCLCEGGSCDYTCEDDEGGCDFECTDGAECNVSCPGGNCTLECQDADSCTLDCPGGNCTANCATTGECRITSCEQSCPMNCGGADVCSNSCDIMSACPTSP